MLTRLETTTDGTLVGGECGGGGQPVRVAGNAADAHWAYVDEPPVDVATPRELPLHVVPWPSPSWCGIVFAAGMVAACLIGG